MIQAASKTNEQAGQGPDGGPPEPADVYRALEEILASQPFRTSKQCQDLLRYVVQHSLTGDDTSLRERVVGVEVFGRAATYDTSEDPVVRMRAADVRKRLAQYYQSAEYHGTAVHIELRPGSYRAAFHSGHALSDIAPAVPVSPATPPESPVLLEPAVLPSVVTRSRRTRVYVLPLSALAVLLVVVLGILFFHRDPSIRAGAAQRQFWEPLIGNGRPILLCLGSNVVYILRPELLERYQQDHGLEYVGPEFFPDLPKGGSIRNEDLLPQPNTFITVQDVAASAKVIGLLSGWSKSPMLRSADDVSMSELRDSPTILVGGFNNRWTIQTMNELPFVFRDGTRIESRTDPSKVWRRVTSTSGTTEDFALISRVPHANTGGPVLAIGGVGSFGTQAAAEFVSSSDEMEKLLQSAPPGWEKKNMQVVLRIKVIGYAPVAVEVVATTYW